VLGLIWWMWIRVEEEERRRGGAWVEEGDNVDANSVLGGADTDWGQGRGQETTMWLRDERGDD
jgi:hypothetical protein